MNTFPTGYGESEELLSIDTAMLPHVSRAVLSLSRREYWATDEDWRKGYRAAAEIQRELAMRTTARIVDILEKQYRLLDAALNGTVYSVASPATLTTPAVVTPEIPFVPGALEGITHGLRAQLLAGQGELPGGWFGLGERPATVADIVTALRAGSESETEDLLDKIDLLGDASDVGSIFNTVKSTVADLAEVAEGGGTLATLVVATLANAAAAGMAAGQMDTVITKLERLIRSLDGGASAPPDDNVLLALRGTEPATAERNLLVSTTDEDTLLLTEIRDSLQ